MKKQLFSLILSSLFLISTALVGQNTHYPTKKVNGVDYYLYTVGSGESLFGICRKFEIAQPEMNKLNPDIKAGIKVGQQILIPISKKTIEKKIEKTIVKTEEKAITPPQKTLVFLQHKVEKKQTIFSIAAKYSVSQEDLLKYNPEISKGLREGIILQIPQLIEAKNDSAKKATSNTVSAAIPAAVVAKITPVEVVKSNNVHQVQAGETLYSISRRYKIEVTDIIRLNPESATTLTTGTELKIPTTVGGNKSAVQNESNTTANLIDVTKIINTKYTDTNKVIRIAFLLPFMLDQGKNDPTAERFVDFYSGALIAIQEAKQRGVSFEIYTYDTEKTEQKVTEILNNSELKTMNLIIGPAFSNQVSLVSDFAKENKINTLIPFTSKLPDIDTNPYLFQFNPGADAELKFATELFTGKYINTNIIFAEIPNISSSNEGKIWVDELQKELRKKRKTFSQIELTTSDYVDFKTVLKKGQKNLIIFNSDKFTHVSPFIAPLRLNTPEYDIVLFEQFNWKNQDEKMPVNISISPFLSEYNTTEITAFNEQYTQAFGKNINYESPRYDLLGYDLSNYFISLLQRYGTRFPQKIGSFTYTNGIQSQVIFQRSAVGSGFINQRLYLEENN